MLYILYITYIMYYIYIFFDCIIMLKFGGTKVVKEILDGAKEPIKI